MSHLRTRINLFIVIIYFRFRMNEGYNVQGIYTHYKTKSIVYSLQRTLINYNSMNNTETGDLHIETYKMTNSIQKVIIPEYMNRT